MNCANEQSDNATMTSHAPVHTRKRVYTIELQNKIFNVGVFEQKHKSNSSIVLIFGLLKNKSTGKLN